MVQHLSNSVGKPENATSASKKAIPLPPPPSFTNGNAYGGNQSFVQSSNELIMGTPLISGPSNYWDNSAVAGSSNSGVRVPGVVGLTNIGNTCFMNSGLQCLLNTPSISEFFLKSKSFNGSLQKLSLLNHFQYVVKQAWYGPNSKINLNEFKSCLAAIHSQFNDSRQHDCQEFLALLLDSLHEQLKKWTDNQKEPQDSGSSKNNELSCENSAKESRLNTPESWMKDDSYVSEREAPSRKEMSVTQSKGLKPKNLPDVIFSQDRKHSGLSLRSNETVSKSKPSGRFSSTHVKNPVHSGVKHQNMVRNRLLGNFEAKHKYQSKNARLRGATISLFQLPNFTPPGYISSVNCDKDISSSSSASAAVKENKWMELKNHGTFARSNLFRNRKKKCEDVESPGSPKKIKFDVPAKPGVTDAKRKLEFVPDQLDRHDSVKSARFDTNVFHAEQTTATKIKSSSVSVSQPDKENPENSLLISEDELIKAKKIPPAMPTKVEEAARAKSFWEKHINANNTVIAKTFQGLLKSTVICATCSYNSVTYEPFMYLSLPFPRVLERKLSVWFISMKDRRPVKMEVIVGLMDTVRKVKHEVGKKIPGDAFNEEAAEKLLMAEVCNYCVHRLLDNNTLVRKLNDNRNLYVFELNENFDERYNSFLSSEGGGYSFSSTFVMSDSVSSTTRGQMNASTYLDEDWDHDGNLTVAEEAESGKLTSGPVEACGSKETKPLDDIDWDEPYPVEPAHSVQDADSNKAFASSKPSSSKGASNVGAPNCGTQSDILSQNNDVNNSEEPNSTMDTNWSDDICTMQPSVSSEADDSGLGSGTSESADSGFIGGTCEATDSDFATVAACGNGDLGFSGIACESSACSSAVNSSEASPIATESAGFKSSSPNLGDHAAEADCSSENNEVSGSTDACEMEVGGSNVGSISNDVVGSDDSSVPELLPQEKPTGSNSQCCPASVSSSVGGGDPNSWKSDKSETIQSTTMHCIICLEDCLMTEMRQHVGCDCVICSNCVRSSIQHFVEPKDTVSSSNKLKCATCMKIVDGSEFIPYVSSENDSIKLTMELIPLVFRLEPNADANNNSSPGPRVFGYPWIIKLPSSLPAREFHDYISSINPFPHVEHKVITVTSDGKSCGSCGYASSCTGCELPKVGEVTFRYRSSIAISYTDLHHDLVTSIDPTDMAIEEHSFGSPSWVTPSEPNYDIHDCLRAFSEIEHLDEQNPWFCPHCDKNQCAKKVLSVCHFPDYLIVYLKRFVFLDHSSNKLNNKLKFPVSELDLGEYIAEEFAGKDWKYDLYGCICHFGSVSSGHYTAFGKNPASGDWHYFNDDLVSPQCPKDLEHSSAYVLFYARKGVKYDIPLQSKVRPLPALNTLTISRPVNVVTPSTNENEAWDPEDDDQVTSSSPSSSPYSSFPPQPVHCSFSGGGTVDSMEELSFSVNNTQNPTMSQWPADKAEDDYSWENEDPIATADEYKARSKYVNLDRPNEYDPMLINGPEFQGPVQSMTASVGNSDMFPNPLERTETQAEDISREIEATDTLD